MISEGFNVFDVRDLMFLMLFEYKIFIAVVLYLGLKLSGQIITFATAEVLAIDLKYMWDYYKYV